MSAVLDAAQRQASRRRPVFPCCPRTKRPLTVHGFKDATTDPAVITGWFQNTNAMLGMPTGVSTGLVVVDIDGDTGFESLRALEFRHGSLPATASVVTPRGGSHLYFKHPGVEVRCSAGSVGQSIDIRGDGGYVIIPPSRTADGRGYEVDEDCAPAPVPDWLLDLIGVRDHEQSRTATSEWLSIVQDGVRGPDPWTDTPSEGRNDKLTRLVGHLLRRYVDVALVHELAHLVNAHRFKPPLGRFEVDRIVNSIAAKELRRRQQRDGARSLRPIAGQAGAR
jgi:Bifunctional DNA primase/polymerase, N-terminal/Primase C terminal 1 (PriCT-1)